jgi:hypothetical protein
MDSEQPPKDSINVPPPPPVPPPIDTPPTSQPEPEQRLGNVEANMEERMSAFERSSIRWTTATFAVTLATGLFIALQWWEIRTGSVDTHTLAEAAKTTAEATQAQVGNTAAETAALQDQVNAIKTQMRQDQRPYVEITLGGPGPNKPFEVKMPNNLVNLPLKITVWGKTPAKHVHGRLFLEIVKVNQDPLLDKNTVPPLDTFSGIVFPGVPGELRAVRMKAKNGNKLGEFDLLKDWEASDISASRSYLAAYGTYTYDDSFGVQHWTKFCVSFQATNPITYPTPGCVRYNEVDNNQ